MIKRRARLSDYKNISDVPMFARSTFDPDSIGYLYVIGLDGTDIVKIGSATAPTVRLKELQCANPFPLYLRAAVSVYDGNLAKLEFAAHRLAKDYWVRGEWFNTGVDNALAFIIKAARNSKVRIGPASFAYEAVSAAMDEQADSWPEQEEERRAKMRLKLGMEA